MQSSEQKSASESSDEPMDIEKAVASDSSQQYTDWEGPNDPDNPLNWPKWLRYWQIVPPALIAFSATLASSIYTPAYPEVQKQFGVSTTVALLPLSLYVLALGFGPVIAAPLSETFGRRVVYFISPPLGVIFTLGAGFSPSFAGLCILRFLAGVSFSPPLAVGAGTTADCNMPNQRALPTSLFILSPFLGPALGPVIGSFVSVRKGWQWTQWTIIFFAVASWLSISTARETYKPIILARRRKAHGVAPPPSPFPNAKAKIKFLLTVTLFRPVHMLMTESIVAFLSIYVAFNFGVLFAFFAAFPYTFRSVYGFSIEQSGLVFLAVGVGCVLAIPTCYVCDRIFYQKQHRLHQTAGRTESVRPEHRLYAAMFGSIGLPIGLFWFSWTARFSIHWICPILAIVPFAWGNLSIFVSSALYLVDAYAALNGASAMAANGLLRYTLGAVFPLFSLQMFQALGIDWACSLLGFVSLALMPIPWVLFKWGEKIRARSQYGVSPAPVVRTNATDDGGSGQVTTSSSKEGGEIQNADEEQR